MKKPFRTLGYIAFLFASFFLLMGLWTFSFDSTQGKILAHETLDTKAIGGFPGIPHVPDSGSSTPQMFVTYQYEVEEKTYKSHTIGMGIRHWTLWPFGKMRWEKAAEFGRPLVVYYSTSFHSISVLHKGFDVLVVIFLSVSGWSLVRFSRWLDSHAVGA